MFTLTDSFLVSTFGRSSTSISPLLLRSGELSVIIISGDDLGVSNVSSSSCWSFTASLFVVEATSMSVGSLILDVVTPVYF